MIRELVRYKLPYDLGKVPDEYGGIYFFSIRFPTDYELGVSKNGDIDTENVLKLISDRVNLALQINAGGTLDGTIIDKKAGHLRTAYAMLATPNFDSQICESLIREFDIESNRKKTVEFITFLRVSFLFIKPLYIGLTREQSFSSRLTQHLNGQTNLLDGLNKNKIDWNDLSFSIFSMKRVSSSELRSCEKIVQNIHKPLFSIN